MLGLSLQDLATSYPINGQSYFHIDEHPKIKLAFGKDIPGDNTYTSALYEFQEGAYSLVNSIEVVQADGVFEQDLFKECQEGTSYKWILNLDNGTQSTDIIDLEFSTSQFPTFADKVQATDLKRNIYDRSASRW